MSIDWIRYLGAKTESTGWAEADGPDSGVGESYWFGADDGRFARLSVDQDAATLDLMPVDDDEEERQIWSGTLSEAGNDPDLAGFVIQESRTHATL